MEKKTTYWQCCNNMNYLLQDTNQLKHFTSFSFVFLYTCYILQKKAKLHTKYLISKLFWRVKVTWTKRNMLRGHYVQHKLLLRKQPDQKKKNNKYFVIYQTCTDRFTVSINILTSYVFKFQDQSPRPLTQLGKTKSKIRNSLKFI